MKQQRKAVALISGGLDSLLAAKAIIEQGVHVEGINFYTGFCHSGHTSAIRSTNKKTKPLRNDALWVAEQLGIKLHIIDIVEEYKDIVINPKHGFGKNINPCLDCKIFMVKQAFSWMQAHQFDFIITGEVVGQRPKSQRKETMPMVAKQSGALDRLVRPLCAKNLAPTLPEREGWIDRERLFDFHGRNRKPQISLAAEYGYTDYAQPSGGCCVLTDAHYATKLQDMWLHRQSRDYTLDDIVLLKVGRHLRPRPHIKMIIGRDEGENNFLNGYRKEFCSMRVISHASPLVLIEGIQSEEELKLCARIVGRFSGGKNAPTVQVSVMPVGEQAREISVNPMPRDEVLDEWYV